MALRRLLILLGFMLCHQRYLQLNTQDELRELIDQKGLSGSAVEIQLKRISLLILCVLKHQVRQIKEGRDMNNYVLSEEMSSLDKKHLKDVFHIVKQMQSAMASQYKTALL